MHEKKRVLHLLTTNKYSGAENVALTIIKMIEEKSQDYEFFYVSPFGEIQNICAKRNVAYVPIKKFTLKNIKKVIDKIQPDMIHAHDAIATVKAIIIARNIQIISHLHNNNPIMKTKNLKSFLYMLCTKKVKIILTVSDSVMNEYVYANKIKCVVRQIGNPIDFEEIVKYRSDNKCIDVIYVGRMTRQKNPERFVDICENLIKKNNNIKCMMIGDGESYEKIRYMIDEKNLQKNIIMKGFLYQPYAEMASAKVLLMTSEWEGYGLVAIESMIAGTLVVAHRVGGLIDIINNAFGFTYLEINDAVEELEKLITDSTYYEKKKIALDNYIKKFNDESYCSSMIKIYREVCNEKIHY